MKKNKKSDKQILKEYAQETHNIQLDARKPLQSVLETFSALLIEKAWKDKEEVKSEIKRLQEAVRDLEAELRVARRDKLLRFPDLQPPSDPYTKAEGIPVPPQPKKTYPWQRRLFK